MKKYLVALASGGVMEQPDFTYSDYDIIEAQDENEACEKYNQKHNCSYFYGACIGEYNEQEGTVTVPISHFGIRIK